MTTHLLIPNFITEPERIRLKDYALHLYAEGKMISNSAGSNRYYVKVDQTSLLTPLITALPGFI